MKVFLDANVLVSVLNKEYPLFGYSSRILSLNDSNRFRVYTSPICLAIAFYFAEKKSKSVGAKQKMNLLYQNIGIAPATDWGVKCALNNVQVLDFEDGLEYYSAIECNCDCLVTEDVSDFYFADIEVLDCKDFTFKYMSKKS